MSTSQPNLSGAFTALITPFTTDGAAVDVDRLKQNINHQSLAGVTGVVPCGTTGETPTLSDEEFRLVVKTAIEVAHPLGLLTIPGAGSNNTAHAIELHRFVHASGADAALHVSPYYNKPSQEGLFRHFTAIADSCDLPIVLYNIPGRTGVLITFETIQRLAAHDNIIAIKDATGSLDLAAQIAATTDLIVLSGDDPLTLPLATVGAKGVVSVLSNLMPDRVAALCNAFLSGDWDTARTINNALLPIARSMLTLDTNPIPIKTAMHLAGRDTGALRLPLCPPNERAMKTLRELVSTCDLQPAEAIA